MKLERKRTKMSDPFNLSRQMSVKANFLLTISTLLGFSSIAYSAQPESANDQVKTGLKAIDFFVIAFYMLTLLVIGWFYSRKNKTKS